MMLLGLTLEGLLADEKEARPGDSSLASSEIACPGASWTAAVQIHWLCLSGSQGGDRNDNLLYLQRALSSSHSVTLHRVKDGADIPTLL